MDKKDNFKTRLKRKGKVLAEDERGSITIAERLNSYAPAEIAPQIKKIEWSRKIFHLSASIIPLSVYFIPLTHFQGAILFLPLVLFVVISDLLRFVSPSFNDLFLRVVGFMMRKDEAHSLTTSTYFALSIYLGYLIFGKDIAIIGTLYLCFGDPAAAIVGTIYGKIRIFNKTLEGSLACFQVCFLIGLVFLNPIVAFIAALITTLAELLPFPLDDNARIPIAGMICIYYLKQIFP